MPTRPRHLVQLYILADYKDVPELKTGIIDKLKAFTKVNKGQRSCNLPSFESVGLAYESLPVGDVMRKLLVKCYSRALRHGIFELQSDEAKSKLVDIPEFAADLVAAVMQKKRRVGEARGDVTFRDGSKETTVSMGNRRR